MFNNFAIIHNCTFLLLHILYTVTIQVCVQGSGGDRSWCDEAVAPHSFALFNVSNKENPESEGFWHVTAAGHMARFTADHDSSVALRSMDMKYRFGLWARGD